MENLNRYLGRPKEEIESLRSQVDAGIKCVLEISKSKKGKYIWSMSHHQLSALDASLKRLHEKLVAQTARNGMETLLCTRMIFGLVVVIALVALLLLWGNGLIRLHAKESPGLKITENSLVNMDKASTIRVNHAERNWLESVFAGGSCGYSTNSSGAGFLLS
ncbi:PREDICTED: inactive receptor kinase At3g08680 [Prunus dulcis]|uniref:PREDICTED: inactive receptor kinase At3g08680 n=1 Tax=Prunus dulcis TaxID=3755 RepID=A0A5E4E1G7_PRUDU|nr:hypothetical protein L3X38_039113 [Prunus dulcis]VVA09574.1 PREDICTED: inactive receptor kinase At3g08680 [Prunus dulcis]